MPTWDATSCHSSTREAFWSFRSIDPSSGEAPTTPQLGFLPPNDAEGSGTGWVEYSLEPRDDASSGPIRNEATITFDFNDPITASGPDSTPRRSVGPSSANLPLQGTVNVQ